MDEIQNAVSLRSVSVIYGKGKNRTIALDGIDLDIAKGKIYAFIGPSGCGKTTLVHCCVGFTTPKKGSVKIFGETPGTPECGAPGSRVGYMPQELALYPDFTIAETMMFFGRLYGVPLKEILTRTDELVAFLKLPIKSRLVCQLSGGQQRRVSFAVALVHRPWLIAVDEPTVGLDPVLRQNIWDYLSNLTQNQGMTVIITTHYIEEARAADCVCFMREGNLLTTGNPGSLMERYSLPTLEDIFLKLCLNQEGGSTPNVLVKRNTEADQALLANGDPQTFALGERNGMNGHIVQMDRKAEAEPLRHRSTKFSRVTAMCWKNVLRLRRNLGVVIFQYLTPALCIILFCTCFGRDPHDIKVAVNNMDIVGELSVKFLESIDNSTIQLVPYDTMEDALNSLQIGDSWAVIHLERGFSRAVRDRFMYLGSVNPEVLERSMVKLHIDWTNHILATHIQKAMYDAVLKFAERCTAELGKEYSVASQGLIEIQKPVFGEKKQSLTEFMTPGNILVFLFFSAAASTALVFVMERKEGMLKRAIVAGVHPHEFLTSHLLQQIFILLGQTVIMLCFTFLVFQITNKGSYVEVIILILLQGVCGMSYGLFISAISYEESHAFVILMGSLLPNFLVSGFIWPLETMPTLIMRIGHWLPNARAIEALRFIMYRGWGIFDQYVVFLGFAVTMSWILFFQVTALHIFKRTNKL